MNTNYLNLLLMKKVYEFYFLSEKEALDRGQKLERRLCEAFPTTTVSYSHYNTNLKVVVESENVDTLLSVYPFLLADENIVGDIRYYISFESLIADPHFSTLSSVGALIGDVLNEEGLYNLKEKHNVAFFLCREKLEEYFGAIGLEHKFYMESWNPSDKREVSLRYFSRDWTQGEGFVDTYNDFLYLYDYENHVDENRKKYFYPLPESKRYPWLKYIGNFMAIAASEYWYAAIDKRTYGACDKVAKKIGCPTVYDPLTHSDDLVIERPWGNMPETADLLSMKFFCEDEEEKAVEISDAVQSEGVSAASETKGFGGFIKLFNPFGF